MLRLRFLPRILSAWADSSLALPTHSRFLSVVSTYRSKKGRGKPGPKQPKELTENDIKELEKTPGEDVGDPFFWKNYKDLMDKDLFPLDQETKIRNYASPEEIKVFLDKLHRYEPAAKKAPQLAQSQAGAQPESKPMRLESILLASINKSSRAQQDYDAGFGEIATLSEDPQSEAKSDTLQAGENQMTPQLNIGQKLKNNWKFRLEDFTRVITSQALNKNPHGALKTFELMKAKGFRPDTTTYTAALMACGRANMPDRALELFKELRGKMKPTYYNYGALVDALGRCKYIKEAFQTMDEMLVEGINVSEKVYHSLMRACIKINDYDSAIELFNYMRRTEMKLDKRAFSTMIFCHAKIGNLERAMNFFQDMETMGIFPDRVAFTALIYANARRGNKEEAYNLMEGMAASGALPDIYACNAALFAFARGGDISGSLKVMKFMTDRDIDPDEISYNTLLHAYANGQVKAPREVKEKNIEEAQKLFGEIKELGFDYTLPSVSTLVRIFAEGDDADKALSLIKEFPKWQFTAGADAYHPVLKCYIRNEKYEQGFTLVDEMRQSNIKLDYRIYEQLFMACCRMKDEAKLLDTLDKYLEWRKTLKPLNPESEVLKRPWLHPPNAQAMMNVQELEKEKRELLMTEHTRKMILKNFSRNSVVLKRMIQLKLANPTPNRYDYDEPSPPHGLDDIVTPRPKRKQEQE